MFVKVYWLLIRGETKNKNCCLIEKGRWFGTLRKEGIEAPSKLRFKSNWTLIEKKNLLPFFLQNFFRLIIKLRLILAV